MTWANLVVYATIAVLCAVYWSELRWAARELPRYVSGDIGSPVERQLYRRARGLIRSGERLDEARSLLERAVAIDPTCEAVYWLGELHLAAGRDEEALAQFLRYLDIDPTIPEAYLAAAAIQRRSGRPDEAGAVLRRGLAYFGGNRERYWPYTGYDVADKYERKAIDVYRDYGEAARVLQEALDGAAP